MVEALAQQTHLSRRAWLALLASASLSSCFDGAPLEPARLTRHPSAPVLVLVVLDGVRLEEVSRCDLAPCLSQLPRSGGCLLGAEGPRLLASGPDYVSLPGYAEIFTGRRQTGCRDNRCRGVALPTLLDRFAASPAGRPSDAVLVGSWPELVRVAGRSGAVSVGRTGGYNHRLLRERGRCRVALEDGRRVAAEPGAGDYRPDRHTVQLALACLDEVLPRLLIVSLGDADEHAHRGERDKYFDAVVAADRFVSRVRERLLLIEEQGLPTALFVTADHGRADDLVEHGAAFPESARVWLAAAGSLIGARGRRALRSVSYLADIAPTLLALGGESATPHRAAGRILWELGPRTSASL